MEFRRLVFCLSTVVGLGLSHPSFAINEGQLDSANDFPNVGALVALKIPDSFQGLGLTPPQSFGTCTLIHPRVALTAAHNIGFMHFLTTIDGLDLADIAVSFSPNGHDGTMQLPIQAAIPFGFTFPPNNIARSDGFTDVGVFIFPNPVQGIDPVALPTVPLPAQPEAILSLKHASDAGALRLVGYGAMGHSRPNTGFARPSGLRSVAEVQFLALRSDYLLGLQNFAQEIPGSSPGDSGGSLFWDLDDGRVQIGVLSGGDPVNVSLGIYQRTDTREVIDFIQTILALVQSGLL